MTQGIVSAVVKKLADLLVDEVRSLGGVDRKLDEVKLQLGQMQRFLEDADSKTKRDDERIKGWVCNVRSVAYETEDAIDTFLVETNYQWLSLIPNGLLARRTLGKKISKIQAKIHIISEGRTTFGIKDLSEDRGDSENLLQRQPPFIRRVVPGVDNSEIDGFEAEERDVINLLLPEPSNQSQRVVSIVGPGGLGKTTLAHKVYTSSTVKNHFKSCRLWITVSRDFNLLDVLRKIHQKLANNTKLEGEGQEDQIVFLLGEVNALLKNKKYLIVLDDVWSENFFTQLETGLINVGHGIRVLMTTRSHKIANCAGSSGVYKLRFLNKEESIWLFLKKALPSSDPSPHCLEEESLRIFQKKALPSTNHSPKCPSELFGVATELVERCNGLPLALIVLGGLLFNKPRTPSYWYTVLRMLDWHVIGQGECIKILATSYDDLNYHLKSCFRYLACFPKDYKISAKPLMKMWVAEGLIEERGGQLEDYAKEYLEELEQRCLVQDVERSTDGAIKSIRVHDLLREVALGEATKNDFLLIWKEENAKKDVSMARRVAFHEGIDGSCSINHTKELTKFIMPKLQTFLNFNQHNVIGVGFLLLRVLELRNTQSFKDLPMDLKNMIHLRYFGLRGTGVTVIPTWIGDLQNLQTFDIKGTKIRELPEVFWKITSLRHVHSSALYYSAEALVGPPSTAYLVNLRSLGMFEVPISWKKTFPNLPGIRKLQLLCHGKNDSMLIHDLISNLKNLLSVRIEYNFDPPNYMIDFSTSPSYLYIHTMYLSGKETVGIAEMPLNLTKLTLSNFSFYNDPMEKLEKLRSLKYLELNNIEITAGTIVCRYRGFPQLESLKLYHVKEMKNWEVEYGALSVLKYLLIKSCYNLYSLPDLRHVPTIQELRMDLVILEIIKRNLGEEWRRIEHIPSIITQ